MPGRVEDASPEPIFQRPVFMGSGLAAARRPGMTGRFAVSVQNPRVESEESARGAEKARR